MDVLFIDDDHATRRLVQIYLSEEGHTVALAEYGEDGIRRFREGGIDLVILDHAWDRCTLFDINFRPRDMSVDELQQGFVQLAETLYSESETQRRRRRFRRGLRTSPSARKRRPALAQSAAEA